MGEDALAVACVASAALLVSSVMAGALMVMGFVLHAYLMLVL